MTDGGDVSFGRRDERFETSWLVVIAIPGRKPIRVSARDVSKHGAKLSVPEAIDLPETFAFRVLGTDFVVQARQIWRRGNFVGVSVEATAPLPKPEGARKVPSAGPAARGAPALAGASSGEARLFRGRHEI